MNIVEKIGGWTTIFLFLGAISTFVGAVLVEKNRANEAETLASKSDEITRLTKANAELIVNAALKQAKDSDTLKEKSDQLAAKSDEIARLTKTNADILIGGNSFCFLWISPDKTGQTGDLAIEHRGEFPVYDVHADIVDFSDNDVSHDDPNHPEIITGNRYNFDIGNVVKGMLTTTIGKLPLPKTGDLHYGVFIQARNGEVTEDIRGIRREDGKWQFKIQVTRLDPTTKAPTVIYKN